MKDYSKEKADVFSTPEEGLAKLTEIIGKSYTEEEIANVKKAYELAAKVHEGQKRLSGEPYIMHPLSVALILARLGMDDASIIAAMLHDTVEDTDLTNDEIKYMSEAVVRCGGSFVKTGTGWGPGPTTLEHVKLIKSIVGNSIGIKASAGIRTLEKVIAMKEAGATRFGISRESALAILDQLPNA